MFSSSNNINPFPQPPSSSSSFHVPLTDAEAAGFFPFHHQHDPLLAGYYVPAASAGVNYNSAPQIFQHLGVLGHDLLAGGGGVSYKNIIKKDNNQESGEGNYNRKAPGPRKDRHSKISTSQGLRDRRVRLSIGISREFFDLQDMLGFDTASKTLGWLLGKSKKDIQELEEKVKNKNKNIIKNTKNMSSSSNNNSDYDQESNEEEDEEGHVVPSEKKVRKSQKEEIARECRAKARERARERTREKLCTSSSTNTCSTKSPHNHHHHHHYHNHHSNPNYHLLTQLGYHHSSFLGVHDKPSSSNSQQQQQQQRKLMTINSGESAKGFVDWDISNAIRRSSICTATNLSTELQMYGKP